MRRLTAIGLLIGAAGCKTPKRVRVSAIDDEEGALHSIVQVSDPKTALQLVKGFHELEGNTWRWTKGQFAVTLRPPLNAASDGAWLVFRFVLAESVLNKVGGVRLTASIGNVTLAPEAYEKTGEHMYRREVPAAALQGETVTVEFRCDKFLAAGQVESRELALIAYVIGLEAK
ncbi:MAG: hypothetical protein HY820_43685 [Acidobacteria bacterium]|nr:hypothetical protein [Acidobacteriota bacterium]